MDTKGRDTVTAMTPTMVIIGGASGIGLALARRLAAWASVISIDIEECPEPGVENITFDLRHWPKLGHLLSKLPVVNLRVGGGNDGHSFVQGSIAEPFAALAELQQEGWIKHLGISTANAEQIAEARAIAPVVCVQNFYNVARRGDDDLIDALAAAGIAYVPYFPLGGFTPLGFESLSRVAAGLGATPMAVALAWLLQRSANILLIPAPHRSPTCARTSPGRR
jgi:aryl-alcohol dehydrogenase-like predicted oxidoreductase